MNLKGKKVLIVGIGRSGIGALKLLRHLDAHVLLYDDREVTDQEKLALIRDVGGRLIDRADAMNSIGGIDLAVISPGVKPDHYLVKELRRNGRKVIGEIELAYIVSTPYRIPWYAVTGTNGKSTTTKLLELMFLKDEKKIVAGGNIGNAITSEIKDALEGGYITDLEAIVVEVSSFQIETMERFAPKVATILNITPDHLDRYASFHEYREVKLGITKNQDSSDLLVLNYDDQSLRDTDGRVKARRVYFTASSYDEDPPADGFVKEGNLCLRMGGEVVSLVHENDVKIKGRHNIENALAASLMAAGAGVSLDGIAGVLREFTGLPHRMEYVGSFEGVEFYNDSKGTNVGAVLKAVSGFKTDIVLILGGRDKDGDFRPLRQYLGKPVRNVVLMGEAGQKIYEHLGMPTNAVITRDMGEAVEVAFRLAGRGDTVLLSPGCASFDQYENFMERGEDFKRIVREIKEGIHVH